VKIVGTKGKVTPVKAWIGPEGCRRLRLSEFLDNRHMEVARLSAVCTSRLYHQKIPLVLFPAE